MREAEQRKKENKKSFLNHGDPDWQWIREKIKASTVEHK